MMENDKESRNQYSMNSGWIYRKLCDNWQKYHRYLFSEIEEKLKCILIPDETTLHFPLFTWESDRAYIERKMKEEEQDQERIKDVNNPPYTKFFMSPQNEGEKYYLIHYGNNFLLTYENDEGCFDFFFALKLLVMDEMKLETFLAYQLEVNFNSDFNRYKKFVETVLVKYKELFVNGKVEILVDRFFQSPEKKENKIPGTLRQEDTEATAEMPVQPTFKSETIQTNTTLLKTELNKYGFFDLKMIKDLSDQAKEKLIEFLINNEVPYQIAMIDFLGFIKHLKKEHTTTQVEVRKYLAEILNTSDRVVKGNINVLNESSKENKGRYTAHLHKETVQKDYQKLK